MIVFIGWKFGVTSQVMMDLPKWYAGLVVFFICAMSCFCLVVGAIGKVSVKWDSLTRDSIGCTEYHCLCERALHIHCGPIIPYHALSLEVWLVHLLCLFRGTHDSLCLFYLTGDQEHSHWRNDTCVEGALVMVLKTGPDRLVRPVQTGTGLQSGPIIAKNRK